MKGLIKENYAVKKSNKYVAAFDYIDKVLIVLSATSSGVCTISSVSVVGAPIGKAGASFTLIFSLTTGIVKKLLSITKNKKKKHDKILMLAKSKLNSNETLVSQALIDMEISHEEFILILKEKNKYEKMKENVKNVSEKQENTRLKYECKFKEKPRCKFKTKNQWKTIKNYWAFCSIKNFYFFVCVWIKWLILALKYGIRLTFL